MKKVDYDVVIVGAGPVGLSLALQLAGEGIETVVLEKGAEILREPRAVGLDGESIRTWQAMGLLDRLAPFIHFPLGGRYFNAEGKELFWLNYEGQAPCGFPVKQSFEQGETDQVLAEHLNLQEHGQLWFRHEVVGFSQDGDQVEVEVISADGQPLTLTARVLVGCDGGRSVIRRLMGVNMVGNSNEFPWLVIDTLDPGFTSGPNVMFFCDPRRPGMTLRISPQHRRWEWMLLPGETEEDMLETDMIHSLIAPFTDVSQVEIFRRRVYSFAAVIAERWQDGRVLLAGDAAHMTPPFAGQGLNAGIRDTRNLFWKIALVVKGHSTPELLASYELERREHTRELIEFSVRLGEQIQPLDPQQAAERDQKFFELRRDPQRLKDYTDDLTRPQRIRSLVDGAISSPELHSLHGEYVFQPKMRLANGSQVLLDELLGPGFCILGFGCDPRAALPADVVQEWSGYGARMLAVAAQDGPGDWPQDPSGTLDAALGAHAPIMVLIRPDRFILAAFTPENYAAILKEAKSALCIPL